MFMRKMKSNEVLMGRLWRQFYISKGLFHQAVLLEHLYFSEYMLYSRQKKTSLTTL